MDSLPRTLVVTEAPFGLNNGFGVTLNTFFSGWDAERLFVLYTREETAGSPKEALARARPDAPDGLVCVAGSLSLVGDVLIAEGGEQDVRLA